MRELKVASETLPVKATPLAMLYYRQEFGADMMADFLTVVSGFLAAFPEAAGLGIEQMVGKTLDASGITVDSLAAADIDYMTVLQLVWAMGKAGSRVAGWPVFETWLASLDDLDMMDPEFLAAALEVAADGLFRGGKRTPVA